MVGLRNLNLRLLKPKHSLYPGRDCERSLPIQLKQKIERIMNKFKETVLREIAAQFEEEEQAYNLALINVVSNLTE